MIIKSFESKMSATVSIRKELQFIKDKKDIDYKEVLILPTEILNDLAQFSLGLKKNLEEIDNFLVLDNFIYSAELSELLRELFDYNSQLSKKIVNLRELPIRTPDYNYAFVDLLRCYDGINDCFEDFKSAMKRYFVYQKNSELLN